MKRILTTKALWPSKDAAGKGSANWRTVIATFAVPALLVVAILFLLISFRGGIEAGVADLATLLPVGYAFAAGMVASANPCGILMLTSYAFRQMRGEREEVSTARRALWGLLVSGVVTLGFVAIFAVVGGAITAGGRWLVDVFPYAGLVIGLGMAALGVWLLATRRTLGIVAAKGITVSPSRSLGNAFLFGVTYAVASLSCTLPIFLVVAGSALASQDLWGAFGQFVGYALGMGSVILIVIVGTALFRRAMARWLRALTPTIHRLSAMFLIGAGAYLVYTWISQAGLI